MPRAIFLLPGVGAQGGRVEDLGPGLRAASGGGARHRLALDRERPRRARRRSRRRGRRGGRGAARRRLGALSGRAPLQIATGDTALPSGLLCSERPWRTDARTTTTQPRAPAGASRTRSGAWSRVLAVRHRPRASAVGDDNGDKGSTTGDRPHRDAADTHGRAQATPRATYTVKTGDTLGGDRREDGRDASSSCRSSTRSSIRRRWSPGRRSSCASEPAAALTARPGAHARAGRRVRAARPSRRRRCRRREPAIVVDARTGEVMFAQGTRTSAARSRARPS